MFFPPAQKYKLIKNVSRQLALVCETNKKFSTSVERKGNPSNRRVYSQSFKVNINAARFGSFCSCC